MPFVGSREHIEAHVAELDRLCQEAGRSGLPITATLLDIDEPLIELCSELGVARCAMWAPAGKLDIVGPFVDRYARVAERHCG